MKLKTFCATGVVAFLFLNTVEGGALKKQFAGKNEQTENVPIGNAEQDPSAINTNGEAPAESAAAEVAPSVAETAPSLSTPEAAAESTVPAAEEFGAPSANPAEDKKIIGDPIVLRINGKKEFRRSQILEDVRKIPPQMAQGIPAEKIFEVIREQRLNVTLMTEQAKKAGLHNTKEFLDQVEQLKEDLLGRIFLMRELGGKVENESAIKARFTKYLVEFKKGKEFQVFHILVNTEDEAKNILAALEKKEDFGKLAKEKSIAPSKERDGEEGYLPVDMMPPQIKDKLIFLKSGEYTKEFTKTEHGYHIFKVGDIRETTPMKYEEAIPMLKQMIMREEMVKLMERLEKQVKVERFNEDGTPAAKPKAGMGM
ncbi:MAG: peptidylprolyl isomerase [Holosporaceae bacterium]|nr:peptidylprolyl isomerase [Holosporaceae bacterium]